MVFYILDAESILNNIVALLIVIPIDESEQFVYTFCEKLTKAPTLRMANICFRVYVLKLYNIYWDLFNVYLALNLW